MAPHKDTHIIRASNEGVSVVVVRSVLLVNRRLSYPLHACHSLEMSKLVTHYCL